MKKIVLLAMSFLSSLLYADDTFLTDGYSQTVYQGTWCGGALNVYFRKSNNSTGVWIANSYPSTGSQAVWRSNATNITLDSSVVYKYNEYVAVGYSIPHTYSYKVGRISEGAFWTFDFVNPTTITIPASIDSYSIPSTAFNSCKNLVCLRINKDMNLTRGFFDGIKDLREIAVSSSNSYNSSYDGMLFNKDRTEFLCCPEGRTGHISIPEGTKTIGELAFYRSLISSLVIPESVDCIDPEAFAQCINLTSVKLPSCLTYINHGAFACSAIEDLVVPNSVTQIWSYAFGYCDKLKRLILPESLTRMYIESLRGATNATVVFKGGVPNAITQYNVTSFDAAEGVYSAKHTEEWKSVIEDGKWKGMPMRQFSATVTFNLGDHGTRIGGGALVQEIGDFGVFREIAHGDFELLAA